MRSTCAYADVIVAALVKLDNEARGHKHERPVLPDKLFKGCCHPSRISGRRRDGQNGNAGHCRGATARLPLAAGSDLITIAAFIGGLSAATAMVIVETVALAIMVSNDIVMPLVLQRRETLITGRENVGGLLLMIRRVAICVILLFAYLYYRMAGDAQLASIGLLSFAAVAQLAPAFFIGLIWRRATAFMPPLSQW